MTTPKCFRQTYRMVALPLLYACLFWTVDGFTPPFGVVAKPICAPRNNVPFFSITTTTTTTTSLGSTKDDDDSLLMDDQELLQTVTKSQLQELCQQLEVPIQKQNASKQELLLALRNYANQKAASERRRRRDLRARIEQGGNEDVRERHEIVSSGSSYEDDDEEEDEGVFYFQLPNQNNEMKKETSNSKNQTETETQATTTTAAKQQKQKTKPKKPPTIMTQSQVLAPPPPPPETARINEKGERVVTVYSTTDHNDLTGIAAAQPGQAALSGTDPMSAGSQTLGVKQPWELDDADSSTNNNNKAATSKELEEAKEKVTELVQMLLAMSGAPAFAHFDMPEDLEDIHDDYNQNANTNRNNNINGPAAASSFVGFDPSKVPTHVLTEASQSLRANRGQVLQEVLREFELHAVGQDGMAGDKREDGGGHFKEVAKVRAFLEGYRRAQVRTAARSTVSFLLDQVVSEGIDGLDMTLATMTRSNDDSASDMDAYELNDSLMEYLNDAIREQEKKVNLLGSNKKEKQTELLPQQQQEEEDRVAALWNQTKDEHGVTIESIDPNDPKVQKILQDEYEKSGAAMKKAIPEEAPEKLLLLLTLLRERIKTEAAFAHDERRRNLRLLAYCLQCNSETEREELIMKDLGSSIDRLDSFLELLASSIEYAESTAHELQPSKRMPLNVRLLKSIKDLAEHIREQRAWKATGLRP